ncbi:hypothetical protein LTR84_003527 [Exophiala bonariae]|uniref:Uncharacterized protein n=1 Tax=Exophiala bonariae TaxID=1690606 RepID=A0AAV9N8F4_9EURO|nr:hypothetical protein LTR84_003527 [Exophiala bonariae]
MVNKAVVLPIACLSGICAAMLIFIWWFFPKWYKKGVAQDQAEMDQVIALRRDILAARVRAAARANNADASSGDTGAGDAEAAQRDLEAQDAKLAAVTQHVYRPQPVAVF